MRIALIGYGRMNQLVGRLAEARGHTIATIVTGAENACAAALTAERLAATDVAIECTRPEAAPANLIALARCRVAAVCATTGWLEELADVADAVGEHRSALLYSANFSVGAQLFFRAAEDLARRFAGRSEFDGFVTEIHHAAKRDAPSGTARRLAESLIKADPRRGWPITSIRGGHAPGTHTVALDAPFETIRLEHAARSREVFAAGALAAAEWLPGRRGVFTFEEMLFGGDR